MNLRQRIATRCLLRAVRDGDYTFGKRTKRSNLYTQRGTRKQIRLPLSHHVDVADAMSVLVQLGKSDEEAKAQIEQWQTEEGCSP